MKGKFLKEMDSDYRDFIDTVPSSPPQAVSEHIFQWVGRDLNPSAWKVFAKLSLIHLFVGVVSVSLCPQFGVRVFGDGLGLMKYFLHLGTYGCMAACGAFFVGMSLLITALVLRNEEVRKLKENQILGLAALILLSLGAFLMADAEILIGFALAWVLGSFVGGVAALEVGWRLKVQHVY